MQIEWGRGTPELSSFVGFVNQTHIDVDQSICLFVDLILSKACCFGFHVGEIIQLVIMMQLNF